MDAVLGLSVTPSAVGLVLVEGQDADGATMDREGFEVSAHGPGSALQTSEQAAAAVVRTEAIAAGRGHRVHSIGVTWSDDADTEASLLLKSLTDSGFDNIVPIRLSEATDALARAIAEMAGYATTAVCVIEPEHLIALVVSTDEGAVQTAVNHSVVTEEDLIGWLSSVFTKADWEPEALVLVGSAEDLDGLLPVLEEALAVPVFAPAEAQLALARGAALACAQNSEFTFDNGFDFDDDSAEYSRTPADPARSRRLARVGPTALLAAGVVTFVVSVSAALALAATPEQTVPQPRPAAEASAQQPRANPRPAQAVPLPAPLPAVEELPVPAPEAQPAADEAPIAEVAPLTDQATGVDAALPPPDPAAIPPAPPEFATPAVIPPPVPEERPGILQRIRDRLHGVPDDQQQVPAVPPPPAAVPGLPPQ